MARVSTYLNFTDTAEAAFNFYKSVFGTEFAAPITRMGDMPAQPGAPELSDADKKLIMNIQLPILDGHLLMGSDAPASMGYTLVQGNNFYLTLAPDSRADADRLFAALAEGGKVDMPLQEMFWGDYFGELTDKFGVKWLFNCTAKS